ncbi:MAG: hypothetical protein IRZ05_08500 [Micromonosporaceae bacterium]|nr:hypothetical protein [Micromonosporaceae bacterium]
MAESIANLEKRIDQLRAEVRRAAMSGDRARARALRAELREAERAWDDAIAEVERKAAPVEVEPVTPKQAGPLLPIREQVHQALTLLSVPAAPKLIVAVHEAFFAGQMLGTRLTSLRRDEERSFRSAPYSRPYYICSALTADLLSAARGLLAISTWPMSRRIIGPLSPRVDFLTAAIAVAEHISRIPDPAPAATRLLWRFAANIPGAAEGFDAMEPASVARAAEAELAVHLDADTSLREQAGQRARSQLSDVEQLFGSRLRAVPGTSGGAREAE